MTPEQWESAKDIFARTLEQPPAERARFAVKLCGADEILRSEIGSLLAAHEDGNNLLEKYALDLTAELQKRSYSGRFFGPYRIVRELGRGGMGAVFLAERRDDAYKRQVAIKVIRQTVPDSGLEQHFRQERKILALLNHPNIAALYDGGVAEQGEPFFVMEYIDGKPLLEFARNLSLNNRLRLFLKVCSAIAYAHRNLVIHRDLKPSNILVTKDGEPKLLDFGLAKIFDEQMSDATQTATGFRAFTPSYASPEQIRGQKITTASDVYSLGIVLYELLTNERPFKTDASSLEEIIKEITEYEPAKPSSVARTASLEKDPAEVETLTAVSPKLLRGDLDNIVLMALRKEPERRYSSVEQFAQDIERHLQQLPISARPNTFKYRAARFIQRNRIAVCAAALVLITLVGGACFSLWQYRKAQSEKVKAQEVNAFLRKMLLTANPGNTSDQKGYSTTVNDVLIEATKRLDSEGLASQPDVKAELEQIIGSCYLKQGQYDLGERYLRAALTTRTELFGPRSPKLLETQLSLGAMFFARANYDEAEKIYEQNLPVARAEYQKGSLDLTVMLGALNDYALLRRARGDSRQAEQLFRENLSMRSQTQTSPEERNIAEMFIALTLLDQGKFDEAEDLVSGRVGLLEEAANRETSELGNMLTLLGSILMEKNSLTQAQARLREGEQIYRKLFSPNSIAIYDNLRLQAQVSYLNNQPLEAETLINQVLQNYRQNSNPKYINFATALTVQGLILNRLGNSQQAEQVLREALRLRTTNLPPKHFMTALTKGALGEVLISQKKYGDAETLLRESYEDLQQSQTTENQRTITARNRLADLNGVRH